MAEKKFFTRVVDERFAYRLVLSFALMSIIPLLISTYIIAAVWLPDINKWAYVGLLLLIALIISILGFLLSRTVVHTVLKVSETAKEIADGNLSKRIEIRNEHTEIAALVKSFNKVTSKLERKIRELEVSEEKFRHLVDNVPDLLYYLDPQGLITSVNEEVTELLGHTKAQLLGRPFSEIVHAEDFGQHGRSLMERRADDRRLIRGLRVRLMARNGEFRTFEINSRGVYDQAGNFIGTEGLARDIDSQLALESEREEYFHMLTHDIRNPVSAILFTVYMMRDGTIPPEKYPKYFDKIEKSCNGITRLVEDFLEFKKLEHGKVRLSMHRVFAHKMLDDLVLTYLPEAEAKGKTLALQSDQSENGLVNRTEMVVDEKYFPRVIENLITNAIKFANSRIEVGFTENEKDLIIYVRDDGAGVLEEEKDNIFKLFHSAPGSRSNKGIGIGLASAHKIVQMHGGRLWLECDPDGGCSFMVSVPRTVEAERPARQDSPASDAAKTR